MIIFAFVMVFVASCGRGRVLIPHEVEVDDRLPPAPCGVTSIVRAEVYFDGRTYSFYMLSPVGQSPLRDSYSFVGEIIGSVHEIQNATDNLQANHARFIGMRVYHSGDFLLLSGDAGNIILRYTGVTLESLQNNENQEDENDDIRRN